MQPNADQGGTQRLSAGHTRMAAAEDGAQFVKRELFGGAITVEVPKRLVDVSPFRQVTH